MVTQKDILALLRAAGAGSLVAAPFLILTIPIGLAFGIDENFLGGLAILALPLLISGGVTLAALALIGLPLTVLLRATNMECLRTYALSGAIFGTIIPLAFVATVARSEDLLEGYVWIFAIMGGLAGAITGRVWGNHREDRRVADQGSDTPNPIHDLLF